MACHRRTIGGISASVPRLRLTHPEVNRGSRCLNAARTSDGAPEQAQRLPGVRGNIPFSQKLNCPDLTVESDATKPRRHSTSLPLPSSSNAGGLAVIAPALKARITLVSASDTSYPTLPSSSNAGGLAVIAPALKARITLVSASDTSYPTRGRDSWLGFATSPHRASKRDAFPARTHAPRPSGLPLLPMTVPHLEALDHLVASARRRANEAWSLWVAQGRPSPRDAARFLRRSDSDINLSRPIGAAGLPKGPTNAPGLPRSRGASSGG
jgi:hypothetical protein